MLYKYVYGAYGNFRTCVRKQLKQFLYVRPEGHTIYVFSCVKFICKCIFILVKWLHFQDFTLNLASFIIACSGWADTQV